MNSCRIAFVLSVLFVLFLSRGTWAGAGEEKRVVRLGYFPNITHAQAVLGVSRGDFQKALGDQVALETSVFNAGPSVIEALFAGHLDLAYVGPSPTLNGYLQSRGEEVRVICGSADNGVLIVGSNKRGLTRLEDLRGKKIATPQLGNTQDISAKYFVVHQLKGRLKERGGETEVIPIANPDIEILFEKDQLDAAWLPEPWATRLIERGLVNRIAEEKDLWPDKRFAITSIIARRKFLQEHPDDVRNFLRAHAALTRALEENAERFAPELNAELRHLTGKYLPLSVVRGALGNVAFTTDPGTATFQRFFEMGRELNLIRAGDLDLANLVDDRLLNGVLREEKESRSEEGITSGSVAVSTSVPTQLAP